MNSVPARLQNQNTTKKITEKKEDRLPSIHGRHTQLNAPFPSHIAHTRWMYHRERPPRSFHRVHEELRTQRRARHIEYRDTKAKARFILSHTHTTTTIHDTNTQPLTHTHTHNHSHNHSHTPRHARARGRSRLFSLSTACNSFLHQLHSNAHPSRTAHVNRHDHTSRRVFGIAFLPLSLSLSTFWPFCFAWFCHPSERRPP